MSKLNLTALLLGAALFTGIGAINASASDMKCGAGKCGSASEKPAKKCGAGKCGDAKKSSAKKCGAGKCGDGKKEAKKAPAKKCGAGKCGSK